MSCHLFVHLLPDRLADLPNGRVRHAAQIGLCSVQVVLVLGEQCLSLLRVEEDGEVPCHVAGVEPMHHAVLEVACHHLLDQ